MVCFCFDRNPGVINRLTQHFLFFVFVVVGGGVDGVLVLVLTVCFCCWIILLFFVVVVSFSFFSMLPSTSMWGVYSETSIHHYNTLLAHSFTRICMIPFFICSSCTIPPPPPPLSPVTVFTCSFVSFITFDHIGA